MVIFVRFEQNLVLVNSREYLVDLCSARGLYGSLPQMGSPEFVPAGPDLALACILFPPECPL